jgi:hypothetical protein
MIEELNKCDCESKTFERSKVYKKYMNLKWIKEKNVVYRIISYSTENL